MTGFRYHKGMGLPYERQGYIYFVCRSFERLCRSDRDTIRRAAADSCGEYADAVIELSTTAKSYQTVATEHYISVNTLYRALTEFYRGFPL